MPAQLGNEMRMPPSKALGEGLYELRLTCQGMARRITYVFEPKRHTYTLTTFRKQRQSERAQILRARRAQAAGVAKVDARTDNQTKPGTTNDPRRKKR